MSCRLVLLDDERRQGSVIVAPAAWIMSG
jgi:hypothetical protein